MILFFITYILGFIILFSYIIYIIYKDKNIPQSISATVYSLDKKNKWLYSIITFIIAFLIAPYLFEITNKIGIELLAYFTILGMLCTGADPLVHEEKNIIHYSGAILLGSACQVISYLLCPYVMFLWVPYIVYTMYMENGKWNMLFSEIVMMLMMLICGITRYIY